MAVTAPFLVTGSTPEPAEVSALFARLDALESEARAIRRQLDAYRQQHMARTRCWGIDLNRYRRAIEGQAA